MTKKTAPYSPYRRDLTCCRTVTCRLATRDTSPLATWPDPLRGVAAGAGRSEEEEGVAATHAFVGSVAGIAEELVLSLDAKADLVGRMEWNGRKRKKEGVCV